MEPRDGLNSELETFRQQWLSDLRDKQGHEHSERETRGDVSSSRQVASAEHQHEPPAPSLVIKHPLPVDQDDGSLQSRAFEDPPPPSGRTLANPEGPPPKKELVSALDHYEEAMERESQGNMGESLTLYRRAYRLDHGVDRRYREKHFPAGAAPPAPPAQPSASASAPAAPAPAARASEYRPPPIGDLIASFSGLRIEPPPPEIEGAPHPPCPVADLPDELLVHILRDVAVDDVADFARLAAVCRHFAYLVATEQRIWRRVCLGDEVGFAAMHYHWHRAVEWDPLDEVEEQCLGGADGSTRDGGAVLSARELAARRRAESQAVTRALHPSAYPSWQAMFRSRPRLRFNGCYISTVNYVRPGQASTNQMTWGGNPIHIVTYYRYLRFFRDGSCISLLTVSEPADVVHHLSRDLLLLHRDGAHAYLPSADMAYAFKGRWRLTSSALNPAEDGGGGEGEGGGDAAGELREGDLIVETEGVKPVYMYRMDLSLRSAGKAGAARNNKVAWRGFHSYNRLTDDWAEFGLKNDKAFFFSRVKSYGAGE